MIIYRFAVKSSLAGGLVYYTIQEGLWSKPEDSIKFYGKIYGSVAPLVKDNIPKEVINEVIKLISQFYYKFIDKINIFIDTTATKCEQYVTLCCSNVE